MFFGLLLGNNLTGVEFGEPRFYLSDLPMVEFDISRYRLCGEIRFGALRAAGQGFQLRFEDSVDPRGDDCCIR